MRPRSIDRGNWRPCLSRASARGCFNEAPINRPGKCDALPLAFVQPPAASMRPRSIDRGNEHGRLHQALRAHASFNEAPINRPGKCQVAYQTWTNRVDAGGFNEAPINRPGKSEDGSTGRITAARTPASMRPRSIDRGNPKAIISGSMETNGQRLQ